MRVGIIGYGIVGKNIHKTIPEAEVFDVNDPIADGLDIGIVCVPTPMNSDGSCDTSYVEKVVDDWECGVFHVRSTVAIGTCDRLVQKTGKKIVFSPEFTGATEQSDVHGVLTLGGTREDCEKVMEVYQRHARGDWRFFLTDRKTAEMVKYCENAALAAKVALFHEFYHMSKVMGTDYHVIREALASDPRIGGSHTYCYPSQPFYTSKCFDKDLPAFVQTAKNSGFDLKIVRSVVEANESHKR